VTQVTVNELAGGTLKHQMRWRLSISDLLHFKELIGVLLESLVLVEHQTKLSVAYHLPTLLIQMSED
jgi:hypothetical protein